MIEWAKARRDLEVLDRFARAAFAMRSAIVARDADTFNRERSSMLHMADQVEALLGAANMFGWKPPGQPLGVALPRALVTTYLAEIADDPTDRWPAQLEGLLTDILVRVRTRIEGRLKPSWILALVPLYWPFGLAGLLLEGFGQVLIASRLLPSGTVLGAIASPVGRLIQAVVTALELWSFWRLFLSGQLF